MLKQTLEIDPPVRKDEDTTKGSKRPKDSGGYANQDGGLYVILFYVVRKTDLLTLTKSVSPTRGK